MGSIKPIIPPTPRVVVYKNLLSSAGRNFYYPPPNVKKTFKIKSMGVDKKVFKISKIDGNDSMGNHGSIPAVFCNRNLLQSPHTDFSTFSQKNVFKIIRMQNIENKETVETNNCHRN